MKCVRMILLGAALLILNSAPTSAYALTATIRSDPASATIVSRGIECAVTDLTPAVSTNVLTGSVPIPMFAAGVANATGHGGITVALENRDGVKVALTNHPYTDETLHLVQIELFIDPLNPKREGPVDHRSGGVEAFFQYFVSTGSFSQGTVILTIRGILNDADVITFGSVSVLLPFKCSGAGMVEIRLPFSLVYE
jgi:hypothetical protein